MKEKVNLLDTVPVCSSHIITEWEGEYAVLAYPRFKRKWMRRYLLPKGMSPYIRATLEERGTAIWRLIDGKRTVDEIIRLMSPHFPDEEDFALRIATYILQIRKSGFITLKSRASFD